MACDKLDVRPWLSGRHSQLVEAVAGSEDGKAAAEGDLAAGGESRRNADHILLGDADGKEALRELLPEFNRRRRVAEVGINADDIEALSTEPGERRAERGAGGFSASRLCHQSASSFNACLSCSGEGALPWKSGLFSMKLTPLPLMVSQITTEGPSVCAFAHGPVDWIPYLDMADLHVAPVRH